MVSVDSEGFFQANAGTEVITKIAVMAKFASFYLPEPVCSGIIVCEGNAAFLYVRYKYKQTGNLFQMG
jgi:hypothetical protein